MSAGTLTQNSPVQRLLQRCRRQIRAHSAIIGLALVLTAAIGCVLLATTLDYFFGLPTTIRAAFLVATLATVGFVAWRSLVRPLLTPIPDEELGAAIDISSPELHEGLATLVSLERADVTASEAGSELMRRRLQEQTAGQVHRLRAREFVDSRRTVKRWGIAGLMIVAALVPAMSWTSGSRLLVSRLVMPFSNLETASNLFFEIEDGDRTVARGSDVRIAATPKWRTDSAGERPEEVLLRLEAENGDTESLPMSFDEVSGSYVATLANIADSMSFRITGGGATSKSFAITVVDAPEIRAAVLTATPPVYIGRAVERFDGMVGVMEVFERSELEVMLEFNKPVESAALVWERRDPRPISETAAFDRQFDNITGEEVINLDIDAEEMNPEDMDPDAPLVPQQEPLAVRVEAVLTADRMGATIKMFADVGGDFVFDVQDEHALSNPPEPERTLEVTFDQPPELNVTGLRDADGFRPDDIVPANCTAVDDVGIGVLELHYRVNQDAMKVLPATDFDQGARRVQHSFRLQLADLGLKDGDFVTIRARAIDERPEPAPQQTWSREFTLRIDDNAKAAGARALEQETKEMVDALKQLEKQLQKDTDKAQELKKQSQQDWNNQTRTEAERLSEKEQQQGRILDELAKEVATHPLMKESAEKLTEISERLRDEIPEQLNDAVDADRRQAGQNLEEAAQQLEQAQRELRDEIETIEKRAQQEQDLAELNRLALEAEQLAQDSEQLEQYRRAPENKPEELTNQEWDQQLDQRQQELSREREDLSNDLGELLREQPELLESAQQAQREQLAELSEKVRKLAEQQDRVAEGVNEEAKEAARDAREIAKQLQKAKQNAERLNREAQKRDESAEQPSLQPLDDAVEQLNQGNLAQPQQDVNEVAEDFREQQAAQQQKDAAAANQSGEMAKQLAEISEQIEKLKAERGAQQSPQGNQAEAANQPSENAEGQSSEGEQSVDGQPADEGDAQSQPSPVQEMLNRVEELAEAAKQTSENLNADPAADRAVQQNAENAARQAREGSDEAAAGQFEKSANQLRKAGQAAQQGAQEMSQPGQADQQKQMQGLSDELKRVADMLQNMQQDNAAQAAAQQGSQQQIAERVEQLPEELSDMAERLGIPELQMASEAEQAQSAQQAAAQAQQSSQQASTQLQQGQLQQAGQAGEQTAEQLNQLASLAQQAGQQKGKSDSPIPSEVGESVADALQDLQQAAQAMQQSSQQQASSEQGQRGEQSQSAEQGANGQQGQQPGESDPAVSSEGQPGEQGQAGPPGQDGQPSQSAQQPGQPGQNGDGKPGKPSGSQQLSEAAKALAQAAQDALPQQFNPGQTSDGSDSSPGRAAMGNAAMWDGRTPNASDGPADSRDWGKLNDELDTATSDRRGVSRDSEYESLIRMYFREVAKATSGKPED